MPLRKGPVRREVQKGVVDGPTVGLAFLDADDEPDRVLTRDGPETIGGRAGSDDGVLGKHAKPFVITVPDRARVDPDRCPWDEYLGEHDDLGTLHRCRPREFGNPVDGRLA